MWRDRDSIIAIACSAAAIVLPSGELTTTIPARVAAGTSTLSTPTPARPIIFSCFPASIISLVTWVPERIIKASYSGIIRINSSCGSPVLTSTWATWDKISIPAWSIGSETRTFDMVSKWVEREKPTPNAWTTGKLYCCSLRGGKSIERELPTAAVMATSHPEKSPEGNSTGIGVRARLITIKF